MNIDNIDSNIDINNIFLLIDDLSKIFDNLFNTNIKNSKQNPILIKYNFLKECPNGSIEYKRSLVSYKDNKIEKLIRQIYWRIYEGLVTDGKKICYYIIGLEDSGLPSNLFENELELSLEIIINFIPKTNLKFSYLYLKNEYNNSIILLIKFWFRKNDKFINYFE